MTTAPFHPASNGLAERFVKSFKLAIKKNIQGGISVEIAVINYLASYRFTPNSERKTPAELIHNRPVRTLLSQLFEQTDEKQTNQQSTKFQPKQKVYVKNFGRGEKWIDGEIKHQISKMLYIVNTTKGVCRRHINQIRNRTSSQNKNDNLNNNDNTFEFNWDEINNQQNIPPTTAASEAVPSQQLQQTNTDTTIINSTLNSNSRNSNIPIRKSNRVRQRPARYQ